MPLSILKDFLDEHEIRYVTISHSMAYTAAGIAALTHIPGKEIAKTVIVNLDHVLTMVVVSASQHVDLAMLKDATGARTVTVASEEEFKMRFPDCEVGAMPPFGNLYGMKVLVDIGLSRDREIAFNAGSHRELVRVAWGDFERLVQPRLVPIVAIKRLADAA